MTLQRFSAKEELAWEAAWEAAHAAVDATYDAERDAACAASRHAILTGDDADVAKALAELAALGEEQVGPGWCAGVAPPYPRMALPSRVEPARWRKEGRDAKKLKTARAALKDAWEDKPAAKAAAVEAKRGLSRKLKKIDADHTAALWTHLRAAFDYPVFLAAPKAVGISSTGDTGDGVPSDLPQVLGAWRTFHAWVDAGAKAEELPDFQEPLAA